MGQHTSAKCPRVCRKSPVYHACLVLLCSLASFAGGRTEDECSSDLGKPPFISVIYITKR